MKMRFVLAGIGAVVLAFAQTAADSPGFDVVSVKPHELPPGRFAFRWVVAAGTPEPHTTGNRYLSNLATVQDLLMEAYGVYDFQLSGLPEWARPPRGEHFDIDARSAGEAAPSTAQLRLMLQRMLAERFQLKLHREMQAIRVYALVVVNPPKIKEITKEQFDAQPRYARMPERLPETMMVQMPSFASTLRLRMDRPVLDETKLTGYYEMATPEWRQPDQARSADSVDMQAQVFSELESRDGLKLEARKDPFEVLVIDHVEKPSPN
jgi:uncharacterized protein (TIGR03435 family)